MNQTTIQRVVHHHFFTCNHTATLSYSIIVCISFSCLLLRQKSWKWYTQCVHIYVHFLKPVKRY